MEAIKTPIQELIFVFNEVRKNADSQVKKEMINVFTETLKIYLQKEKQFAFECFEAGKEYYEDCIDGNNTVNFDQFYSQYEQK